MEISQTTQPLTLPSTGTTEAQAAAVLSSDFEVFLEMLTAQARYQDPLEPIDSSEYAAQLAQFSMVEQQVQSNDLLRVLSDQLGQGNLSQMASWLGKDAKTTAPVNYDGLPITVYTQVDLGADEAFLIVYDADGVEVQRQSISTDTTEFQWIGGSANGSVLPDGVYSFAVESWAVGKPIGTTRAETYDRITEARTIDGSTTFVLSSGAMVTSSEIMGLREPG